MNYKSYGVKDMGWVALVGKTVAKLEVNAEKKVIRFTLSDGSVLFASAVGDCCSQSWFENLEGEEALIGNPVISVVDRKMPEAEDKTDGPEYGNLTQFYGWTLETSRGRFDIEMRNESNGYYGGNVIVSDVISDQYNSEVEEPFVPAPQPRNGSEGEEK